jgi:hypothetical protein
MKNKIKVLKDLLELVQSNYFSQYFKDRENDIDEIPAIELKGIVQDFLECRVIELEQDKDY